MWKFASIFESLQVLTARTEGPSSRVPGQKALDLIIVRKFVGHKTAIALVVK